jgi:ribosomal protein S18 acetylase RimI-like enzyme
VSDLPADVSPASLERGVKANLYAFLKLLGRSPAAAFVEEGPLFSWHTPVPNAWFNGVLASGRAPDAAGRLVADRLAYFQERGVEAVSWWLEPEVEAMEWEPYLHGAGFRADDRTPGMAVDLSKLRAPAEEPDGLEVLLVDDDVALRAWIPLFLAGFGLPATLFGSMVELFTGLGLGLPVRHYLGYRDGGPVATSTLFLGAGVAGIYNVTTVAEARGRGIGTALTVAPLRDAQALGYKVAILQSSEKGFSVYRRLGFEEVGAVSYYQWRHDTG